jgi:N-methylhydantoinase A
MLAGAELTRERIAAACAELAEALDPGAGAELEALYELRYRGQSFELGVPGSLEPEPDEIAERFATEHERRYGYRDDAEVELVNIRLASTEPLARIEPPRVSGEPAAESTRRASFGGEWLETKVLSGEPPAGTEATGPCIFELPETTLVLPPGWRAEVDERGTIRALAEGEDR